MATDPKSPTSPHSCRDAYTPDDSEHAMAECYGVSLLYSGVRMKSVGRGHVA